MVWNLVSLQRTFRWNPLYENTFPKEPVYTGSVGPSYFKKSVLALSWKLMSVDVISPFSFLNKGVPSSLSPTNGIENKERAG